MTPRLDLVTPCYRCGDAFSLCACKGPNAPQREPLECWLIVEWFAPLNRWHRWPRFYGSEQAANKQVASMHKNGATGPRIIEAVRMVEASQLAGRPLPEALTEDSP